MITIAGIKEKQPTPSKTWIGNVKLSDNSYKIVIIKIIDEEESIVLLETNGKKMINEPGWVYVRDGFYTKEAFAEEIETVFNFNSAIAN